MAHVHATPHGKARRHSACTDEKPKVREARSSMHATRQDSQHKVMSSAITAHGANIGKLRWLSCCLVTCKAVTAQDDPFRYLIACKAPRGASAAFVAHVRAHGNPQNPDRGTFEVKRGSRFGVTSSREGQQADSAEMTGRAAPASVRTASMNRAPSLVLSTLPSGANIDRRTSNSVAWTSRSGATFEST